MTTRLVKVIDGDYSVEAVGAVCAGSEPILTFQECFHAAASSLGRAGQTFLNTTGADPSRPVGCSVTADPSSPPTVHTFFNTLKNSTAPCGGVATTALVGGAKSLVDVSVALDVSKDLATITLSGPSDVWFGVGFGAQAMADEPWTIIVDGTGAVTERKIGGADPEPHVPGALLTPSVTVTSSSVVGGTRTVTVTRALAGAGPSYYSFNASAVDPVVSFINAVGSGPTLDYHKNKAPAALALLPAAVGACVCPEDPPAFGQATGQLVYHATNQSVDSGLGSVAFAKGKCASSPYTNILDMNNPTCDIRAYAGGQWVRACMRACVCAGGGGDCSPSYGDNGSHLLVLASLYESSGTSLCIP
jgi:hypothetical protein